MAFLKANIGIFGRLLVLQIALVALIFAPILSHQNDHQQSSASSESESTARKLESSPTRILLQTILLFSPQDAVYFSKAKEVWSYNNNFPARLRKQLRAGISCSDSSPPDNIFLRT